MLAEPNPTARVILTLALGATACSHVPPAHVPPFTEATVLAEYTVGAAGTLPLPVTTRDLVVRDLVLVPAPLRETFGRDGARAVCFAAGTTVAVRCRYRAYATADGRTPTAAELFPGADRLTLLDRP